MIKCGNCETEFAYRKNKIYCSRKCKERAKQRRTPRLRAKGTSTTAIRKPAGPSKEKTRREKIENNKRLLEQYYNDENYYTTKKIAEEFELSLAMVSVRTKALGIEAEVKISYSGVKHFYTKEQAKRIATANLLEEETTQWYKDRLAKQKKTQKSPRYRKWKNEWTREYNKDYLKERRQDPSFKMRMGVSSAVRKALLRQGKTKGGSTFEHLPYTPQDLKEHLEKKFVEGMTWENYGDWHLDHIVPQAALPYDSLTHPNFTKCWALDNLQPLWARDNIQKSSFHNGQRHSYL